MSNERIQDSEVLCCSFCLKSQDSVQKLITGFSFSTDTTRDIAPELSPSDNAPRPYICDECVMMCDAILETDRETPEAGGLKTESVESDARINRPSTPELLAAVERWITEESLGAEAAERLKEVRATAIRWMQN